MRTIGTVAYTTTNDWDNSIIGMVNFLRSQYKENHPKVERKDLETFNADLKISGFETGNEIERGQYLTEMGLPLELLFDKEKASYPDKSCVLTDLSLAESFKFMKTLHGKKYNDSALQLKCSIYIIDSKIPSPKIKNLTKRIHKLLDPSEQAAIKEV